MNKNIKTTLDLNTIIETDTLKNLSKIFETLNNKGIFAKYFPSPNITNEKVTPIIAISRDDIDKAKKIISELKIKHKIKELEDDIIMELLKN